MYNHTDLIRLNYEGIELKEWYAINQKMKTVSRCEIDFPIFSSIHSRFHGKSPHEWSENYIHIERVGLTNEYKLYFLLEDFYFLPLYTHCDSGP